MGSYTQAVRRMARRGSSKETMDISSLLQRHGHGVETHSATTDDGYLLTLHRIAGSSGNAPVVYCHHGLMTCSELWVLGDTAERCLPLQLAAQGYDVWLGNNRGNKYSTGHTKLTPAEPAFWDFSIDQFALKDIPTLVNYVLQTTNQKKLKYIGFSQGSSQLFAALSSIPELNDKIEHFTALSPVMVPQKLTHPVVTPLVLNPHHLKRIFGQGALLPFVPTVRDWVPSMVYNRVIDISVKLLFQWVGNNISPIQKQVGYPHLYSVSSVKSVMHWFQIIRDEKFQSFDLSEYKTENIVVPVLLIYGNADCLVDIDRTVHLLKCPTTAVECDTYEHMDTLWATDCVDKVFSVVIDIYREIDTPPCSLGSAFI